ncbi:SHSP domain-containing protein [Trichostrongylus colubriformis]|uniref:SHSP domain-containing protein n=1 Tax=Trichostrongylus colubriformis TaxID=6319 RepID=A0AAN8F0S3_TRICO
MPIWIQPCSAERAILPRFLDDVFNEIDNTISVIDRFEKPTRPSLRRRKEAVVNNSGKITDDESKLAISLNVSKFKPEELKVNIDGRTLTIEGQQEVKDGSSYTMRSFVRQWNLPEDVDVEQIRSTLTENGQLAIEVPKAKPAVTARNIPIQKAISQQ